MPSSLVQAFFDEHTSTFTYVVHDADSSACAIIDSVLDYDAASGRTSTASADKIIAWVRAQGLSVQWILETHAHADHLSAAAYLKEQLGGQIAIGAQIRRVQQVFKSIFNLEKEFLPNGSQFDRLLNDGEHFQIGNLRATALHVPGHTPADMAYRIENIGIFVGDTLFLPDVGTARCDFPGGDAPRLYESIQEILGLDENTVLYMCHDYPPPGRAPQCSTTVGAQRNANIHVHDGISANEFVAMRTRRDQTLGMPTLILPAIQVNIRAGYFPEPEANGVRYLKIPVNGL